MRKLIKLILIVGLLSLAGVVEAAPEVVDSYSGVPDGVYSLYNGSYIQGGQTVTSSGDYKLTSVDVYLSRSNATGNAVAKLYGISGTPGTNGVPNGTLLATSDNVSINGLTGEKSVVNFPFSGAQQYSMSSGNDYTILIEYSSGDSGHYLNLWLDVSSPSDAGNAFRSTNGSSWSADTARDLVFTIYGEPVVEESSLSSAVAMQIGMPF